MEIAIETVKKLINNQCPQFCDLEIKSVTKSGHDNRTFHLGVDMIMRLPSGKDYVLQVDKENRWLPYLGSSLSLPISQPLFLGSPTDDYPYPWSILKYLDGETVNYENVSCLKDFAFELSAFLKELQSIDTKDAPIAGQHNFYRGGNLMVYHQETQAALAQLENELPTQKLQLLWQQAIQTEYLQQPVWIHGDVAPGNLLVQNGHLCGVIDFGIMGIGDPACDYAMAWTFFDSQSRLLFLDGLPKDIQQRAMGWALWKALITYHDLDTEKAINAKYTINQILNDY